MPKQTCRFTLGMNLDRTLSGGWVVTWAPNNSDAEGIYIERNIRKFAYKWLAWNQVQQPRRIVGRGNTMKEALLDATKTWGCTHCDDTHTSVLDIEGNLHYNCPNGEGRYFLLFDPEACEDIPL